jgi:hypothetical protein
MPASAQPEKSLVSTEWPTSGTERSCACGNWAAVRRASSVGVRRSSRPDRTSTGTSGPALATPSGFGVGGHAVHSSAAEPASTVAGRNGANGDGPSPAM